jgi:hypothetical protein
MVYRQTATQEAMEGQAPPVATIAQNSQAGSYQRSQSVIIIFLIDYLLNVMLSFFRGNQSLQESYPILKIYLCPSCKHYSSNKDGLESTSWLPSADNVTIS